MRDRRRIENEFRGILDEYSGALAETIDRLRCISTELCLKSRGEGDYPHHRYQADMNLYNASVDRYMQVGTRLNDLYQSIVE